MHAPAACCAVSAIIMVEEEGLVYFPSLLSIDRVASFNISNFRNDKCTFMFTIRYIIELLNLPVYYKQIA